MTASYGRPKVRDRPCTDRCASASRSVLARIRLSHVWAVSGVVIPVIVIAGTPLAVIDLTYDLRAGDIMFDTHALLRTDVFSAVAYGSPGSTSSGGSVVLATAFRLGGGSVWSRSARSWGPRALVRVPRLSCRWSATKRRHCSRWPVASAAGAVTLRPQSSDGLFAVTAWLVARRRTHPKGVDRDPDHRPVGQPSRKLLPGPAAARTGVGRGPLGTRTGARTLLLRASAASSRRS